MIEKCLGCKWEDGYPLNDPCWICCRSYKDKYEPKASNIIEDKDDDEESELGIDSGN